MNKNGYGLCLHEPYEYKGTICLANDDDGFYVQEFNSREEIETFVDQLRTKASEVFGEPEKILESGPRTDRFYWVLPVIDIDENEEWIDDGLPAVQVDEDRWALLGNDIQEGYLVRWVGPKTEWPNR